MHGRIKWERGTYDARTVRSTRSVNHAQQVGEFCCQPIIVRVHRLVL